MAVAVIVVPVLVYAVVSQLTHQQPGSASNPTTASSPVPSGPSVVDASVIQGPWAVTSIGGYREAHYTDGAARVTFNADGTFSDPEQALNTHYKTDPATGGTYSLSDEGILTLTYAPASWTPVTYGVRGGASALSLDGGTLAWAELVRGK